MNSTVRIRSKRCGAAVGAPLLLAAVDALRPVSSAQLMAAVAAGGGGAGGYEDEYEDGGSESESGGEGPEGSDQVSSR